MKLNQILMVLFTLIQITKQSGSSEDDDIEKIVFFILIGLILGFISLWIKKLTTIPYTPLLIIFGMILGIIHKHFWKIGESTNFVLGLSGHTLLLVFIPPLIFESSFNTDFFTFRKGLSQISLLAFPGVACTCLFIAIIMKYILQYDYLNWGESLTLGAILAATDPVAVVALLKELGTSIKFNILLEGESLLNDGTATVFFFVFFDMVLKGEFLIGNFFEKIFRLTLGGPALGLIVGMLAYPLLKKLMNNHSIFVLGTIFLSYFTFYLCESTFLQIHVSGILALVCQGVYLSYKLKGRIVGSLEEQMHSIWHFLAYIIETLLFVLTGAYLGRIFVDEDTRDRLHQSDIWKVFIFQFLLFICRGIVLSMFWPLLNLVGSKLSWKDIFIMTYAGLRGAIGLSLALFLQTSGINDETDSNYNDYQIFKTLTIFYVCITILFTVLVQGMTIKYVMQAVDFVQKGVLNEKLKIIVKERLLFSSISKINQLKKLRQFDMVNWMQVEEVLKIHEESRNITRKALTLQQQESEKSNVFLDNLIASLDILIENKKEQNLREKKALQDDSNNTDKQKFSINVSQSKFQISQQDNTKMLDSYQKEIRDQVQDLRQTNLHKHYENPNLIKSKISLRKSKLQDSEDQFQYHKKRRGFSHTMESQAHFDKFIVNTNRIKNKSQIKIQIRFRIYKMVIQATLEKYEHKMCIYQSFRKIKFLADSQSENIKKLSQPISFFKYWNKYSQVTWLENLEWKLATWPLIGSFFQKRLNQNLYENFDVQSTLMEVLNDIVEESDYTIVMNIMKQKKTIIKELQQDVKNFKNLIDRSYDNDQIIAIRTRKALRVLYNHQYEIIQQFFLRGELTAKERDSHLDDLSHVAKAIETYKIKQKSTAQHIKFEGDKKIRYIFMEFNDFTSEEIEELESKIIEEQYERGDHIYILNEKKPEYVYLLAKGYVTISIQHYSDLQKLGFGEIVGAEYVYSSLDFCLASTFIENPSLVFKVPIDYFKNLCEKHENLKKLCQREQTFYRIKCARTQDIITKQNFYTQMKQLKPGALKNLIKNSEYLTFVEGQTYETKEVVYIYSGQVEVKFTKKDELLTIKSNDVIPLGNKVITAQQYSVAFVLDISPYINQTLFFKDIFLVKIYIIQDIFFNKKNNVFFIYFILFLLISQERLANQTDRYTQRKVYYENIQSQKFYKQFKYRYRIRMLLSA